MTRLVYLWILIVLGLCLSDSTIYAQNSGGQDSIAGGTGRPRRDTYIIETYPSPALPNQNINIAYYNHNPEETSLRIVDINDKTVIELQPRQFITNGIHRFTVRNRQLASGTYFIRLTSFTSTGSKKLVQDSRFIVVH
jgi:hypothetical protein